MIRIAIISIILVLAGCMSAVEHRGHTLTQEEINKVRLGMSKTNIYNIFGTPSSTSLLGQEEWYYISSKEEDFAFCAPSELERQIVAIRFSNKGLVESTHVYNLEDSKPVQMVTNITPTPRKELSILEGILDNIGRFNNKLK